MSCNYMRNSTNLIVDSKAISNVGRWVSGRGFFFHNSWLAVLSLCKDLKVWTFTGTGMSKLPSRLFPTDWLDQNCLRPWYLRHDSLRAALSRLFGLSNITENFLRSRLTYLQGQDSLESVTWPKANKLPIIMTILWHSHPPVATPPFLPVCLPSSSTCLRSSPAYLRSSPPGCLPAFHTPSETLAPARCRGPDFCWGRVLSISPS